MESFSQHGQDRFVYETFFKDRTEKGTYVDIGAYDGVKFSNSFFFERHLGWRGICIEPLPNAFEKLKANRTALCLNCAISDHSGVGNFVDVDMGKFEKMYSGLWANYDPRHLDVLRQDAERAKVIQVDIRRLEEVLDAYGMRRVDYMSIDTEGSELKILKDIDLGAYDVRVLSVENNYGDPEIRRVLVEAGYHLVHVFSGFDELYVKESASAKELLGF